MTAVLGARGELGAAQVPRDFAGVLFEQALHRAGGAGLLPQQHFARDLFDFGVGELDGDAEAVAEPLQRLVRRERGLAGSDEQHAPGELRLHGFGDVGDGAGTVRGLADVLLHFVQHEDGGRDRFVGARERFLGRGDEFGRADVGLGTGELLAQQQLGGLGVGGELGRRLHQGVRQDRAHVEVDELAAPILARVLHRAAHHVQESLLAQPEAEAGLGVVLGPAAGSQDDGEDRQADMLDIAAQHRTRGGDGRHLGSLSLHVQLSKLLLDGRGQTTGHERPRGRPVLEPSVGPDVREHLEEVGLAAAEEAAHPDRVLPGSRGEVRQILAQHPLQGVGELAAADERLQFGAEFTLSAGVVLSDPRLATVGQLLGARVPLQEFVDLRGSHCCPCGLIVGVRPRGGRRPHGEHLAGACLQPSRSKSLRSHCENSLQTVPSVFKSCFPMAAPMRPGFFLAESHAYTSALRAFFNVNCRSASGMPPMYCFAKGQIGSSSGIICATKSSSSPGDSLSGINQMPTRGVLDTMVPERIGLSGKPSETFLSWLLIDAQRSYNSSLASKTKPTAVRPGALISFVIDLITSRTPFLATTSHGEISNPAFMAIWIATCLSSFPSTTRRWEEDLAATTM